MKHLSSVGCGIDIVADVARGFNGLQEGVFQENRDDCLPNLFMKHIDDASYEKQLVEQ